MKRFMFALVLASFLSLAWSADKDGQFRQFGVPHCRALLEAVTMLRASKDKVDYPHLIIWGWIAGYLTSYNMNVADTYDVIGHRDMLQIEVEAYCRAHPKDDLVQFMRVRLKDWYPERQRASTATK